MNEAELLQWIRGLYKIHKIVRFYQSPLWRKLRAEVLEEQHNECKMCKDEGKVEEATVAHHIKHVYNHPELALTKENLICVCAEHHYQIHHTIEYSEQLNEEKW